MKLLLRLEMRSTMMVLGFISLGAAMALRWSTSTPKQHTTKSIVVSPTIREIRANKGEMAFTTSYTIWNRGGRRITLGEPSTTCGCSVASIGKKSLEPGDSTEIMVRGEPPPVGRKSVEIRFPTDAKDQPEVGLELIMLGAGETPYVAFDSKAVNFGTYSALDLPARQEFMIMTRENEGRPPWIDRVWTSIDGLGLAGGLKEERSVGNGVLARTYRWEVTLESQPSTGTLDGVVMALGVDRSTLLELPVSGRLGDSVVAVPSTLFANLDPDDRETLELSITSTAIEFDISKLIVVPPVSSLRVRRVSETPNSASFEVDITDIPAEGLVTSIEFRTNVDTTPEVSVPVMIQRSKKKHH